MSHARRAPATATGFAEVLALRAARTPDALAYGFLDGRGRVAATWTYGELARRARAIGRQLAGAAGQRVLLVAPPGAAFVEQLFGCFHAGAVAVPVPPGVGLRPLERLASIAADARPALVLAAASVTAPLDPPAPWLVADGEGPDGGAPAPPGPLTLLQYTSGSTGTPRGVMLAQGHLLAGSAAIYAAFGHDDGSAALVWLPPHHDMGLVGGILQPMFGGFPGYLMAPTAFLKRPAAWLAAIAATGATTSGGPNFAYDLLATRLRPQDLAGLDLSRWRIAFSGAEPVRATTLARCAAALAPAGFAPSAWYPCYGLAEATLLATGPTAGAGARLVDLPGRARPLVACGRPFGLDLAIVDPTTLTPAAEGEVWLAGPAVAAGYWDRPAETAAAFGAHLADGRGPYLRTGDMGRLVDGELVLTGRCKDLLIVDGRNLDPHDLEACAAAAHEAVGAAAAFAVEGDDGERIVLALETTVDVTAAVRAAAARDHGVTLADIVLCRPHSLPRTTSGKIRRHAARDQYLNAFV